MMQKQRNNQLGVIFSEEVELGQQASQEWPDPEQSSPHAKLKT
jgi:hypothetical protein